MLKDGIRATREAILARQLGVEELVQSQLDLVAKQNEDLNIFLTVNKDGALEDARKLDQLLSSAAVSPEELPLLGIPLAYKDIFMTRSLRTTAGSKLLENYIPPYSATVVTKLEAAGAITLGKVNCDAWAHGSSGENSDFGPTKNPKNPEYVAGGSSSGSAAAVSAGMVLAATATDTGGSTRLPANFTGTVGYKPTYGRVSRYGVISMASSLDSVGHVTRSVEDAAQILAVTSGVDPHDATTAGSKPFALPDFAGATLIGKRVGVPREYVAGISDDAVKLNFETTLKRLSTLGAKVEEISLPHTEYATAVYYIIQPAEVSSNLARFDGIRFGRDRSAFGLEAMRRIMLGTYTLSAGYYDAYYKTALKVRTLIKQDFDQVFETVDFLVAPVSPTPAFKLGEKSADPLAMYLSDVLTIPANLAGLPALAIPTGQTTQGLPLGVQIIGQRWGEEEIFPAAYVLEQAL